ncbi:ankyrin repeat domain-containing protein [Glaciimonas immobilis]|uniref:Ankyrin repeat domain-containing protein n=1 Tax=Glaciimonas immobilis TaxID=728004 RepID=A0A840RY10_9BURK|nr:ankyrin repeat domain-containing protein [Glaciimonas immobilis]KAF3998673.1 hypothetical protein HAV38_07440 [Glaciimonas immobilis]MBB5201544.1 hypothetical protein [Glaciimonas immobilis]
MYTGRSIFLKCILSLAVSAFFSNASANDAQVDLNRQALAAARSGNAQTFKGFIEAGASPDTRNRLGDSLLMSAIKNGQMDIMLLLIARGADVNLANVAKVTPLMASAYFGRPAMARVLIDKKADVNAIDQVHKTAMVYAAGTGQTEIVNMLLQTGPESGIKVNTSYENGLTALMWAGASGFPATVEALLARGADSQLLDNRGKGVLEMAQENSHLDIVKILQAR